MTRPLADETWSASAGQPPDWPLVPGYELLAELGRGGMGVVYKARQVSSDRLVALKLIKGGALADSTDRARFRIEADAAARMRDPGIVEIYEVGEHAGQPYLAMEIVAGGRLDLYLAGQPQPPVQAAELVRSLALAAQHAHQQQIVHRDLKPANVLLGPNLQPKITDFGLAKRLDSDSTAFTRDGAVLGTASYMAPEQAAGRIGEIGPAADIYSLGAILYELLTGRPPFRADSWGQTVEQVLRDEPSPPTRLVANVPRELESICLRCLEKDPTRRYPSAGELAADLSRFLAGQAVAAAPVDDAARLARIAERDGYQILGEIGRGPRSIVYHALYAPLQQPVALKVFHPGLVTRGAWEARLRRGAELWAALSHPHVVPVQRAGWWDESPYVVLEHAAQGSLAGRSSGQPQPVRDAVCLVHQLSETVGYLHRQGAVHGNLKPSNVLLAADGIPRVSDFRLTGGLFLVSAPAEDEIAGCGYLAPELADNRDREPRPYTDIYGLGLILYELLTGCPPFSGVTAQEVLEQVRTHEPDPPSRLNPTVPPQLDKVCLRCLRKNPWRRFYRVYDLAICLRPFQGNSAGRSLPHGRDNPLDKQQRFR